MSATNYILATAGHVDHGKSALVKSLSGTDPDRLPEERARGLTIDLGFAHIMLEHGDQAFDVGIIDVPGHEDFVKNMVAGVGSIDAALLVIAADDGWMPQTEEHLQILTHLGVSAAVVALTKSDLVSEGQHAELVYDISSRLRDTPLEKSEVIPTSVVTGSGVDQLRSGLASMFSRVAAPRDIAKPRLPVDRVFTLHGVGTVITGTLTGGHLDVGQGVVVQPSGLKTRIRQIQAHNRSLEEQAPGARTGLNLHNISANDDIHRGDVVTLPGLGIPATTIDVELSMSARLLEVEKINVRPLKDDVRVRVHHGSASVPGRVRLLASDELLPGERVFAQLRLEAPVFVFMGDRFIIRDWAERLTMAGGVVLDANAARPRLHSAARREFLVARMEGLQDPCALITAELTRDTASHAASLLAKSRYSELEIDEAVQKLVDRGTAVRRPPFVVAAAPWQALLTTARSEVDREHKAHPERTGLSLAELRDRLRKQLPDTGLFDALVADLTNGSYEQSGTWIRSASHRPELPRALKLSGERLRTLLSARPFEPPARKELASDAASEKSLRYLIESGEAVQLSPDLVMSADAFRDAKNRITEFIAQQGGATVSELRQALGSTRRIMVPLMEKLDSDGITVRDGDKRKLKGT